MATATAQPWSGTKPSALERLGEGFRSLFGGRNSSSYQKAPDAPSSSSSAGTEGINRHVRGSKSQTTSSAAESGQPKARSPWDEWNLSLRRSKTLAFSTVASLWGGVQFGYNLTSLNSPRAVITCASLPVASMSMSMTAVVAGNHSHVASAVDTVKTSEGLGFLPPCLPNFSNLAWGGAVSAFLIGALIGSLAAARIAAKFGRKWTLVLVNLISTPGYILVFFSMNVWMFSIGRLFLGIGAGALATTTSVYLGEIAPARTRGAIGAAFHLSMTCGMLVAMVCGNFMSTPKLWRPLLVLAMFFSIMQVATMPFAVESPRWLVFKGRFVAAKRALRKIRGVDAGESALEVDKEFAALLDGLGVKDLKTKVQDAARAWFSESEMKDMSDSSSSTRSSRNGGSSSDAEDGKRAPPSGVATGAKDPSDSPHEGDDLFVDVEEDIGLGPEDDELFGLNHHAFEEDEDDLDEDDDQSIRPSQDSARGSEAGSATPRKSGSYRRNRLLNNRVTRAVLSMFELLTTKALHKHIFLVCLLQIALPLCGVSAINMYSSTIFSRSFQQSTSLLLTAILGPVLLVSSLIAIPLVDNIGRKPLLVGSFLGMMLCCIAMAVAGPFAGVERMSEADMIYAGSHTHRMLERSFGAGVGGALLKTYDEPFLFDKRDNLGVLNRRQAEDGDGDDDQDDDGDQDGDGDNDVDVVETEDVPMMENPDDKKQVPVKTGKQVNMVAATVFVAFSYIFVAVFSGGLGAIGVMILPELIPLPAVMSASTLAAGLHWTFSILVSFLVPTMLSALGTYTFVIFACLNFVFLILVWWLLPETAGFSIDVLTAGLLAIDA